MIIPYEQTSELSNDSNDDTITDHEAYNENFGNTIPLAAATTHV